MIQVANKTIITPIENILKELKYQLSLQGIEKLGAIRKTGSHIQCSCPIHKNGQERTPSCGIFLSAQGDFKEGDFHCFTCGTAGSFSEFVSYCFNIRDGGLFGDKWLLDNFEVGDSSKNIELPFGKLDSSKSFVTEEELQQYRYYHDYMWKRGLTPELVDMFDVGYDIQTDCITFPVWDINGNCVFVAKRSTKSKFFNYPEFAEKPVYALNMIPDTAKEVYVCESIINCITCWKYGKYAIALIGLGSTTQYEELKKRPDIKRYILAFDGDNAGRGGAQRFYKNMRDYALISFIDVPEGKDINDLSYPEFISLKPHM